MALLASLFLYHYKSKSAFKHNALFAILRFCTIFLILILLINPKIKNTTVYNEKPNLLVVADNSNSLDFLKQKETIVSLVEAYNNNSRLKKKFNIINYQFSDQLTTSDTLNFKSKQTNISEALKFLRNVMKKKAIVFMMSDFIAEDYKQTLKIAAGKHDITGIRIYDKHEENIPNLGMVNMQDEESGELMLVNTSSKQVRQEYAKFYADKVNYFKDSFAKSGAGSLSCRTDESYVKKLLGYFKTRG